MKSLVQISRRKRSTNLDLETLYQNVEKIAQTTISEEWITNATQQGSDKLAKIMILILIL